MAKAKSKAVTVEVPVTNATADANLVKVIAHVLKLGLSVSIETNTSMKRYEIYVYDIKDDSPKNARQNYKHGKVPWETEGAKRHGVMNLVARQVRHLANEWLDEL